MFEDWKNKRKARKAESQAEKKTKSAETLAESTKTVHAATKKLSAATSKAASEEWFAKYLERDQLRTAVDEARRNLFIQRDALAKRMLNLNNEFKYISENMPDTPKKAKELARCSNGSKNAAYALAVVIDAIERLDDLQDEYEWRQVMKDLTHGYKTINAISTGSDLMTRLAFLFQKAKMEMKKDVTVDAMEAYYGKPIDQLLAEDDLAGTTTAAQALVDDSALSYASVDKLYDAISYGAFFTASPEEVAKAASMQSDRAAATGGSRIFTSEEEYTNPSDMNSALSDLPSNF